MVYLKTVVGLYLWSSTSQRDGEYTVLKLKFACTGNGEIKALKM